MLLQDEAEQIEIAEAEITKYANKNRDNQAITSNKAKFRSNRGIAFVQVKVI